jgi:phage terminase large subunit
MLTEEQKILARAITIPSGYAQFRLGMKLHPKHTKVLDSLFSKKESKVSFLAGNSTGKTSTVITAAILYAIEMLNATVVSTSKTYRQLTSQLFPNILKFRYLYPNWDLSENSIKINNIPKYIGFATNDAYARFQGFHSSDNSPLLIIVDEAAGVDEGVYQSIGRCKPTYLLVAGSPLGPEGVFYSIETEFNMSKQFEHIKLTQLECLTENGWWLDKKPIDDFISFWGQDHPLVLSSVYAEFSSNIENGLISLNELNKCYDYPPKLVEGIKHIGIDVASGGDNNVIAYRNGNKIEIIDCWRETEVMRACDKITNILNNLKEKHGITQNQVSLDADGMGIGFISRLKDLGWRVNEYHGGSTPENSQYSNHISEAWMEGVRLIKNCSVILPDNDDFRLQLLSRKQMFNERGKLKLESKADMKSRGIKSPDIADAIFIALSTPKTKEVSFMQSYKPQARSYSSF